MKTIEIMRKLIARPFDNLEEFTKELNRLCNIVEAENERLTKQLENSVKLPCKVGDTVYEIRLGNRLEGLEIMENKIRGINIDTNIDTKKQHYYLVCGNQFTHYIWEENYKDTWFLTKPEAEARLKELEE